MPNLFDTKTEEYKYEVDGWSFSGWKVFIYSYEDEYGVISGEWYMKPRVPITGASYIPPSDYYAPISPEERIGIQMELGNKPRWFLSGRY